MHRRTRRGRVATLVLAGLAGACGSDPGADVPGDGQHLPDPSDGVLTVRHVDPAERPDLPRWTTETTPLIAIGTGEEDGFGLVAGAVFLEGGRIAAADAHARHVRLFGADGAPGGIVGRRGSGPGEFESIDGLWTMGPDSLGVFDLRNMRLTVIGPDADIARSVTLQLTGIKAHPSPLATSSDGALIVSSDGRTFREDVDTYRTDLSLLAYAPDGSISRTIAEIPGEDMWNLVWDLGVTPSPVPFGRPTVLGYAGDAIWVGTNEGYRLDRYGLDGDVSLRVVVDRPLRPLRRGVVDRYRARERAKATAGAAAKGPAEIFTLLAESAPYPESLPQYDGILIDREGRLWVRDYREDPDGGSTWIVFGPDGGLVATAELPVRFRATAIGDGRVLGVWRDDLDVEQVRVYELR